MLMGSEGQEFGLNGMQITFFCPMNLGPPLGRPEARTWSYQKACSLSSLKVFGLEALEDLEGCLHAYSWLPATWQPVDLIHGGSGLQM